MPTVQPNSFHHKPFPMTGSNGFRLDKSILMKGNSEPFEFKVLPFFAAYLSVNRYDAFIQSYHHFTHQGVVTQNKEFNDTEALLFHPLNLRFLLDAFERNSIHQFVHGFAAQSLKKDASILIRNPSFMEDIFRGYFPLRETLKMFLEEYTSDDFHQKLILNEFEKFALHQENIRFDSVINILEKSLFDKLQFTERLNERSPGIISLYQPGVSLEIHTKRIFRETTGYEPDEVRTLIQEQIIHPDDLSSTMDFIKAFDGTGDHVILTHEIRLKKKSGEYGWFRTYGTVFQRSEQGLAKAVLFITLDVDSEKKSFQELRSKEEHLDHKSGQLVRKNQELEIKNKELSAFNYIASHDLQEPLRKIRTYTNMIIERSAGDLSEMQMEFLNRIIKSASQMQTLIDDLLTFSRTASGEKVFQAMDLNILLAELLGGMKIFLEDKEAVVDSEPLPVLNIIPFQFHQLMANLIGNAVKYSRKGIPPHIYVSSHTASKKDIIDLGGDPEIHYQVITIRDNGIGFEQQYAEKIFELFQRLHPRSEYSGTGIGLAICKKIVENHQGFIRAEGHPGEGSIFSIYIPESDSGDVSSNELKMKSI